jgi:uracil-DNA glycosylase
VKNSSRTKALAARTAGRAAVSRGRAPKAARTAPPLSTNQTATGKASPLPASAKVTPKGYPGAEKFIPPGKVRLPQLQAAVQGCRGCDLYKHATQAVFGEGPVPAAIMLIGEQPGDQEDKQGHPFVGPAGGILRKALSEAGIDPATVYITNAVKHFKWIPAPRGKRRLHSKPSIGQVRACGPWLERELELVKPRVMVLLGATAAQSLLGPSFRITKERGKVLKDPRWTASVIASVHPSSILRAPTDEDRRKNYAAFVDDMGQVAAATQGR